MSMSERYPEAEMVLDDELVFEESAPRRPLTRRDERPEQVVREGEVLVGKYRVERIPGRSGMGVLVQVRHLELGQEVTLKFLVPEACAYPEFVRRFVREARAAVKIQGEHVARVTDVGRLESGAPYMVREFLRGPDLAEVVRVRGPLPVMEAVDYVIQACEGVAEGHALGVVHRNLRPTSLVVTRRSDGSPLVKVFDFAAAESLHVDPFTERSLSLVGTSAIMASLPYLSPEQIRDPHDVDVRADIYSLGAILYELLTASPVYSAETAPALLAMVAADPASPVRNLQPDAPGEIDLIVLRCLSKNRAIRYASIADFALALRPFASPESSASIDRVVRLGKRASRPPELRETRASQLPSRPSFPPPAPAVLGSADELPAARSFVPGPTAAVSAAASRGSQGTLVLPVPGLPNEPGRFAVGHDDVTAMHPIPPYQPAPSVDPPRYTPQPPPLRTLGAPPRVSRPPPLVDHKPEPQHQAAPTSVPPPARSSMSGLSRSWGEAEPERPPILTRKRLVGIGVVAAVAVLGSAAALRFAPGPVVAASGAAGTKVSVAAAAPPPPPPAAEVVAPPASAAVPLASASAATAPAPLAAPAAPLAPPVAVAVATPAARAAVSPRVANVPRRSVNAPVSGVDEAYPETTPAAGQEQKVARARPVGGDLFDDMR